MPHLNYLNPEFEKNEHSQKYNRPSKSQQKREMTALQKLGEQLVISPEERIKNAEIPEDLRDAVLTCQKIKSHEGRRRQLQLIGKKMRSLSEDEVMHITKMLQYWKGHSKEQTLALHILEKQRNDLLASDTALTELMKQYPDINAQQYRTLIRNARKEQAENKPPKAYREIFQLLKALMSNQPAQTYPSENKDEK